MSVRRTNPVDQEEKPVPVIQLGDIRPGERFCLSGSPLTRGIVSYHLREPLGYVRIGVALEPHLTFRSTTYTSWAHTTRVCRLET